MAFLSPAMVPCNPKMTMLCLVTLYDMFCESFFFLSFFLFFLERLCLVVLFPPGLNWSARNGAYQKPSSICFLLFFPSYTKQRMWKTDRNENFIGLRVAMNGTNTEKLNNNSDKMDDWIHRDKANFPRTVCAPPPPPPPNQLRHPHIFVSCSVAEFAGYSSHVWKESKNPNLAEKNMFWDKMCLYVPST